jgi:hypothetical protein
MADIRATQAGDFGLGSTWVGGNVPGSGDVAFSNGFTIPVSDTRTVQAISNAAGTSISAGGSFVLTNGANLTCTNASGIIQGVTTASCVTTSLTVGQTATLTATNSVAPASGATAINITGNGTINLVGNYTAASFASLTIANSFVGTLNITGSISAASGFNISGVSLSAGAGAVINHTGNITGSTSGGATSYGLVANAAFAGTWITTGNITAGSTGSSSGAAIVNNSTIGIVRINGIVQASTFRPAVDAGVIGQNTQLSGPFLISSNNVNPVVALSWRFTPAQPATYYQVWTSTGATVRSLYPADALPSGNYPAAANTRSGTVYGPNLEITGTMAVPAAGSVALGVAVDNTVGTAVLTSANVVTALGQFASGRLANVATVDTTGFQIQAAVSA